MTKAGKQILEAAQEAVRVARGEEPAARITIKGHAYVPEDDTLAAVRRVREYLAEEWIIDGCREGTPVIGCVSCQMVAMDVQLAALEGEMVADAEAGVSGHSKSRFMHVR